MKNIFSAVVMGFLFMGMGSIAKACDCNKKCSMKHEAACKEKGLKKGSAEFKACMKEEKAACGKADHKSCGKSADGACSEADKAD